MKTIIIILLSFTLAGFANAQLIRKNIVNQKVVTPSHKVSDKKFEPRKAYRIQKTGVLFKTNATRTVTIDRKKK